MNSLHYPSLELCEKLTEIGFPKTEKIIQLNTAGFQAPQSLSIPLNFGVCPSVMEMLDVMPSWITVNYKDGDVGNYKLEIGRQGLSDSTDAYYVHYVEGTGAYSFMLGTLPNALAEIILWLVENKYLTFNNEK